MDSEKVFYKTNKGHLKQSRWTDFKKISCSRLNADSALIKFYTRIHMNYLANMNNVKWSVLQHLHPAFFHPAPCNIRGACLCKYWRIDYEKIWNGLTSMILDSEWFDGSFYRSLENYRVSWCNCTLKPCLHCWWFVNFERVKVSVRF